MSVDLDNQMKAQIVVIGMQGVIDNQRMAMQQLLAFQKDLFQGGQGEVGAVLAAMMAGDRTPRVKTGDRVTGT
jgi:hypothetical protein